MTPIYSKNGVYEFLRPYVDWMFRRSFRRIIYTGLDNLPKDGAMILSPNHSNGLCDAMAVLTLTRQRKVFAARADMFRSPKMAAFMRLLKILPMRRIRDGRKAVLHNETSNAEAVETLDHGIPFCILPEGTHRAMHSLLPLGKGIFRIALQANDTFGMDKPVYIVPVHIVYRDFFHLWDTLLIRVGEPINVTAFASEHSDMDKPRLIMALRELLTERMRNGIVYLPDDASYAEHEKTVWEHMSEPFASYFPRPAASWIQGLILLLLLPLLPLAATVSLPIWLPWAIIRPRIKDEAFKNSVHYVLQVLLMPLTFFLAMPAWHYVQEFGYHARIVINRRKNHE